MNIAFEDAISKSIEVFLRLKLPDTNEYIVVRFQPYIFGKDSLGFDFIWGYLPESKVFHKLFVCFIEEVEVLSIQFAPFHRVEYLTPYGEEHYYVLKGYWRY